MVQGKKNGWISISYTCDVVWMFFNHECCCFFQGCGVNVMFPGMWCQCCTCSSQGCDVNVEVPKDVVWMLLYTMMWWEYCSIQECAENVVVPMDVVRMLLYQECGVNIVVLKDVATLARTCPRLLIGHLPGLGQGTGRLMTLLHSWKIKSTSNKHLETLKTTI